MRTLITNALNLQKNYVVGQALKVQCNRANIPSLLQCLTLKDFGLKYPTIPQPVSKQCQLMMKTDINKRGIIGIRSVETNQMRISLFYLPQGVTMKLHDHPTMKVITYIMEGVLQATYYTAQGPYYRKEQQTLSKKHLGFIQNETHNLHSFTAQKTTFFVDILFPDYQPGRQCTYYEEQQLITDNLYALKKVQHYQPMFQLE